MPLFGKSTKSPAELVKALKEAVNSLERGDKKAEKAQEDVSKNLVSTKTVIFSFVSGCDLKVPNISNKHFVVYAKCAYHRIDHMTLKRKEEQ